MNARTIKTKIKNAELNPQDYIIEKQYKGYEVSLANGGIPLNWHSPNSNKTSEDFIAKNQNDFDKLNAVAELFGVEIDWYTKFFMIEVK